jgi:hypothetical protein
VPDGASDSGRTKQHKKCAPALEQRQIGLLTISRLYNEAMGKNLADKYSHLSNQLDKIVSDANSEIQNLQNKIKGRLVPAISPTRMC